MSKYYKAEDVERLIENILNVMIGKEEPMETALCELPIIYIVRCEECRWRNDCSQTVANFERTVNTALRWCSDGVAMEKG